MRSPAVDDNHHVVSSREFKFPIEIDPREVANIKKIVFYTSTDQGRTWKKVAEHEPTERFFKFTAPGDNVYWFALQIIPHKGEPVPPSVDKLTVDMKVLVDTTLVATASKSSPAASDAITRRESEDIGQSVRSSLPLARSGQGVNEHKNKSP